MLNSWEEFLKQIEADRGMVAFVGAGGKTTTLFRLARAFASQGKRILVTTTTRIFAPESKEGEILWLRATGNPMGSVSEGNILIAGENVSADGKLHGFSPEFLDRVFLEADFDWIFIEADGSKQLPIKAPGEHEPVIPSLCSAVVGVIGMDCWGCPIDEVTVHRINRFVEITGCAEGESLGLETLTALILHPKGLFKQTPDSCRRILLLNKAAHCGRIQEARSLIRTIESDSDLSIMGVWL